MNWIQNSPDNYDNQISLLKRLDKLTLYGHNDVCKINLDQLSFKSIFNCKKMNRQYSIIGKIQGDLITRNVQISCSLIDFCKVVVGKWQHQKIELTRFAYKYNQKSSNMGKVSDGTENYQIKVNPVSGQFYVSYHFLIHQDLIKDSQKFKLKITDECQKLGTESEKIFNTILQVIFFQEASQPYLKSDERVGMQFSRPVKMHKLLKKIKKMNMISTHYKMRQDTTSQAKLRSFFKKFYLKKTEKTINNPLIIDKAVVFVPKFSKKYLEAIPDAPSQLKKKNLIIMPFQDLEDNKQIEFARHLEETYILDRPQPIMQLEFLNEGQINEVIGQPGIHQFPNGNSTTYLYSEEINTQLLKHENRILSKLGLKHPSMIQYYGAQNNDSLRITEYFQCVKLSHFLDQSSKTISLMTRLDIMAQICHMMEYLHKNNIGYFLDFQDIYITEGSVVKIKNFTSAYSVANWDETKEKTMDDQTEIIMPHVDDFKLVAGYRGDEPGAKEKGKEQKVQKRLENQKADVYCLGMVLYRILMDKFPFSPNSISMLYQIGETRVEEYLMQIWTLETQAFFRQGGMIAKLLGHLLLKCLHLDCSKRPFIQWITVIICETKSSLDGLY